MDLLVLLVLHWNIRAGVVSLWYSEVELRTCGEENELKKCHFNDTIAAREVCCFEVDTLPSHNLSLVLS